MTTNKIRVLALPGDGIGPEVTEQAIRVLDWFATKRDLGCEITRDSYGLDSYERHGRMLREETLADILSADAVLFGATGASDFKQIPRAERRRDGLLRIRREMGVFANLRPVKAFAELADASTLRPEVIDGVDMIIVRELLGGLYFGEPRGIETLPDGQRRGFNTQAYTTSEIRRVARVSFELGKQRSGRVCSVEKSNVMESGQLWREEVQALRDAEFPEIELTHMYADNCAMQLVRNPRQFDVIVTDNMFGDVLSDCAAMITGSLGMLPSVSLSDGSGGQPKRAFYEPIHGSAPDIAGKGIANPLGAILSVGMALRHTFGSEADAAMLEEAVRRTLASGVRTADIAARDKPAVATSEMGDEILLQLASLAGN